MKQTEFDGVARFLIETKETLNEQVLGKIQLEPMLAKLEEIIECISNANCGSP